MIKPINQNNRRRVVVTGLGVVSSLGIGWEGFWRNLLAGKSGISRISLFDTTKYEHHFAGEVKNFKTNRIKNREIKRLGRASQMAITATKLALEDSKLRIDKQVRSRTGVYVGTTTGEIGIVEQHNKFENNKNLERGNFKKKNRFLAFPAGSLSANIALELKLLGENLVFGTACSSGNYALGKGFDAVASGKQDYALVGGADSLSRIVYTGFDRLYAIAPEMCQPFDKNRKGMIPGEGAAILLLESLDSAQKRNAKIYAEILGYSLSCDGYNMTEPDISGVVAAITKCLVAAGVSIQDVDYISAHGTGTLENDKTEALAINMIFGKYAKNIPVSSIKSMLGHTMGAASAFETVVCCLALKFNKVPPTINFETFDSECDIDCVPNKSRDKNVRVALNNSQAFGGNNAVAILKVLNL